MTSNIFDIDITQLSLEETTKKILESVRESKKIHVVTANSEMLYLTTQDKRLKHILQRANIVTPDGVGAVWAARKLSEPVKERVAGFDLFCALLSKGKNINVFLLGAKNDVVKKAVKQIEKEYPNVRVVGFNDGFFNNDETIVNTINEKNVDILFVALGCPKQEYWISNHLSKLDIKVAMGVGGSFDVIAGEVKRAPQLWQKLGLEWAYRLIKQPSRFKRMLALPKFVLKVFFQNNSK
jgi:N-acetylglucosaminyldiphosphoundecaprenol N-acetyl-beta-D-mannosaminyltransferase